MNIFAHALAALTLGLGLAAPIALAQDKPVLNVMTYAGLAGKYGPGPKLKAGFEASCACTLNYIAVDDSGTMLSRLRLEGAAAAADVLVGIDLNLMSEAKATGLFAPHGRDAGAMKFDLPITWSDDTFLPFDYGWFAFVYDSNKLKDAPKSLRALVEAPDTFKILVQDPRTSSPGLGLLLWIQSVYGDKAPEVWAKLKPKVVTFTKNWSEAYGLFLKGEADMVLSYTTSPAYHLIAEKKDNYRAAVFDEGNFMQVEIAAALAGAKQPALAKQFLSFLTSEAGQAVLPTTQWMYPARTPAAGLPEGFSALPKPVKSLVLDSAVVAQNRKAWIDAWLAATAR